MRTVGKAAEAAAELDAMIERDLDRRPVDASGRPRTRELGLIDVLKTPRGREVRKALAAEGRAGDQAVRKTMGMDPPDAPEPSPTQGEQKLERLAKALASSEGVSVEQAMVELAKTAEGRELMTEHRRELAAR